MRLTQFEIDEAFTITPTRQGRLQDPVNVLMRDLGGHGALILTTYQSAWTAYFGNIGDLRLREFISRCDVCYLAGKLAGEHKQTKAQELQLRRAVVAAIAATKQLEGM